MVSGIVLDHKSPELSESGVKRGALKVNCLRKWPKTTFSIKSRTQGSAQFLDSLGCEELLDPGPRALK
jgi:hypothetical protein